MVGRTAEGAAHESDGSSGAVRNNKPHSNSALCDAKRVRAAGSAYPDFPYRGKRLERHWIQFSRWWRRSRLRWPWLGRGGRSRFRVEQKKHRHQFDRDFQRRAAVQESIICRTEGHRGRCKSEQNSTELQSSGTSTSLLDIESW